MWGSGLPLDFSKPTLLNVDYHVCNSRNVFAVYLNVDYKSTLRKTKRVPTRFCLEPRGSPAGPPSAAREEHGGPRPSPGTVRLRQISAAAPPKRWGLWGLNPQMVPVFLPGRRRRPHGRALRFQAKTAGTKLSSPQYCLLNSTDTASQNPPRRIQRHKQY